MHDLVYVVCNNHILSRTYDLLSRYNDLVSRTYDLVNIYFHWQQLASVHTKARLCHIRKLFYRAAAT